MITVYKIWNAIVRNVSLRAFKKWQSDAISSIQEIYAVYFISKTGKLTRRNNKRKTSVKAVSQTKKIHSNWHTQDNWMVMVCA